MCYVGTHSLRENYILNLNLYVVIQCWRQRPRKKIFGSVFKIALIDMYWLWCVELRWLQIFLKIIVTFYKFKYIYLNYFSILFAYQIFYNYITICTIIPECSKLWNRYTKWHRSNKINETKIIHSLIQWYNTSFFSYVSNFNKLVITILNAHIFKDKCII